MHLFAYVDGETVVLGAGLDRSWLEGSGSAILGQRTSWGAVNLPMRIEGNKLITEIGGGAKPPGGFLLPWPFGGTPGAARINGKLAQFGRDGLRTVSAGEHTHVKLM